MSMNKYTVMSNDIHGNHWVETVHDEPEATIGEIVRKANLHDIHLTGTRTIVVTIEDAPGVSRCPDSGLLVGVEEDDDEVRENIMAYARWETHECVVDEDTGSTAPYYLAHTNPETAGYYTLGDHLVGSGKTIAEAMDSLRQVVDRAIAARTREHTAS